MNKSNTLRIEARSSPFAVPMRMNMIFVRNQQLTCLKCLLIFQPKPTNWCANHRCPYFVRGRARAPNLYAACGGQSFINNFSCYCDWQIPHFIHIGVMYIELFSQYICVRANAWFGAPKRGLNFFFLFRVDPRAK